VNKVLAVATAAVLTGAKGFIVLFSPLYIKLHTNGCVIFSLTYEASLFFSTVVGASAYYWRLRVRKSPYLGSRIADWISVEIEYLPFDVAAVPPPRSPR
jgi:hypothetical protein